MADIEWTDADRDAAKAAWNAVADEFNQWDVISLEEAVSWILSFARHRIASTKEAVDEIEALRVALKSILGGQKSAAGTWSEMVEPLVARFDVAANFGGDAVHNSEGSAAIAELLREMSARLDRSVNAARAALTQTKDTTDDA